MSDLKLNSKYNRLDRISQCIDKIQPDSQQDVQFEIDMFLARLELIETKSLQSNDLSNINRAMIRAQMYEFLKDDLVDFLHKILAEKNLPASLPDLRPVHKDILHILKELGVYVFFPPGKDYNKSSIPERWLNDLILTGNLDLEQIFNFFWIYRNRLYSLSENSPYGFGNQSEMIRKIIRLDSKINLSFVQIYRAELKLREQIMFALLRRFSPKNRLNYLVGKEMILKLSDEFIEVLHSEGEKYFQRLIRVQKRRQKYLQADRNKIKTEVSHAAKLQNKNLQSNLPEGDQRINFFLSYKPYMELSGDFYRIEKLNEDEYSIFLCDIAGHGVGAAMYFNTVKNSFEKFSKYLNRPDKLLGHMDKHLYGKLDDNFITAICVHINLKKNRINYCNAGHPKAFFSMLGPDRNRIRFLRPNAKILSVFENAQFKLKSFDFDGPHRLILYTDGISELFNDSGHMLGERGLLDIFKETPELEPKETFELVEQGLAKYQGSKKTIDDDRTMIIADIDVPIVY